MLHLPHSRNQVRNKQTNKIFLLSLSNLHRILAKVDSSFYFILQLLRLSVFFPVWDCVFLCFWLVNPLAGYFAVVGWYVPCPSVLVLFKFFVHFSVGERGAMRKAAKVSNLIEVKGKEVVLFCLQRTTVLLSLLSSYH